MSWENILKKENPFVSNNLDEVIEHYNKLFSELKSMGQSIKPEDRVRANGLSIMLNELSDRIAYLKEEKEKGRENMSNPNWREQWPTMEDMNTEEVIDTMRGD